jgi:hypothetical protein
MRKLLFIFLICLQVVAFHLITQADQSKKKKPRFPVFQLELYGGFSSLNPSDLNHQAEYNKKYLEFFRNLQHIFYSSVYGNNYVYTGGITGDFIKIKRAIPFGFRFKYNFNRFLSVSLGCQYLSKLEVSNVKAEYGVEATRPDYVRFYDMYYDYRNYPDYQLGVNGFIPMVGIHFNLRGVNKRSPYAEGFISGGPLFGSCSHISKWEWGRSSYDGYWRERDYVLNLEGKGTGLAVELGLRLNIPVLNHFDLFLEGGYVHQRVKRLFGSALYEEQERDLNSEYSKQIYSWEGDWVLEEIYIERWWGILEELSPTIYREGLGSPTSDFNLNLSGFRLKLGISWKF